MNTYQEHLKIYRDKLEECHQHIKKQDTNRAYFHTIFKNESERLNALEILDKAFEREHDILLTELMKLHKIKIELKEKVDQQDAELINKGTQS